MKKTKLIKAPVQPKTPYELVKEARVKIGYTQQSLGDRLQTTAQAISNVERGVTTPSLGWLWRLCNTLGIEPHLMAQSFADMEYARIIDAIHNQQVMHALNKRYEPKSP